MKDIIIIGAGPAGMTAALYALRADKSVLLLEKENFGGQITYSPKLENYPSVMEISGSAFAEKMLKRLTAISVPVVLLACFRVQIYKVKLKLRVKRGDLWLNLRLFKIKRGYLC